MNGIPPIHIMQPSGRGARRQFSETLLCSGSQTDLGYIKSHLREIRELALSEQTSLAEQFKDSVNKYRGIDCLWARDAAEAVNYIKGIVRGTNVILVNRSSSVVNELMPVLGRLGCRIVKPYYNEFGFFREQDQRLLGSARSSGKGPRWEFRSHQQRVGPALAAP